MDFDLDKMYCGAVKRGDVVICEHDGEEKIMVVLQDDVLNGCMPTVIGALVEPYISGNEVFLNEVLLKSSENGLGKDGLCMLHKLLTVDRRNVISKKAELTTEKANEIFAALDITFGRFRDREVETSIFIES